MDTSLEAYKAIQAMAPTIREQIYRIICKFNGVTNYQLVAGFGYKHQTATARVRELAQDGRIQDSGRRGLTGSGRKAIVWEAVTL